MKRLVLFCLMLASPLAASAAVNAEMYLQLGRSVLKVHAIHGDGAVSLGSAVAIAPDRLVTNCHVTRSARHIVLTRGSAQWRVDAQVADVEHDLCVLHAPGANVPVPERRDASTLRVGEDVFALGYPGGARLVWSDGRVKGLHLLDGAPVIRSSAAFTLGASGGGLFDPAGRLVGITTFHARAGQDLFFAVPTEWVMALARRDAERIAPVSGGEAFWQRAVQRQPLFLQAGALEAGRQWPQLKALAERWSAAEAGSPEPWIALGKALRHSGRHRAALDALRRSVQLDPLHTEGWYQLGLAYRALGDHEELQSVRLTLAGLDADMARILGAE